MYICVIIHIYIYIFICVCVIMHASGRNCSPEKGGRHRFHTSMALVKAPPPSFSKGMPFVLHLETIPPLLASSPATSSRA